MANTKPKSSQVTYQPVGAGAVVSTVESKLHESVNVKDFGAKADGITDNFVAFSNAIASLNVSGGKIIIGPGTYVLSAEPVWNSKSVYWEIDPAATFTGPGTGFGKFPYADTNPSQMAVGPFIQSRTHAKSAHPNGGVSALQVEMIQPENYGAGQSVALYAGAKGSSNDIGANVWAVNALIAVESSAAGTYQCIEVDVDTNSTSAVVKGISISGAGSANPGVGLEITRLAGVWDRGVHVLNAQDAIVIEPKVGGRGIVIGSPAGMVDVAMSMVQSANNADTVFVQRVTDTAPGGYLFRAVNAANTSNLVLVDVLGNITIAGLMTAYNFRTSNVALPVADNTLSIGSGVSITASAGTNGPVPSQVAAYLEVYHGANKYRIPMFN